MKQMTRPLDFIHEVLTAASEPGGLPFEIETTLTTLTELGDTRVGWPEYPKTENEEEIKAYWQAEEKYFGATGAYYKENKFEKSIVIYVQRPEVQTLIYRLVSNMVYAEVKTPAQLGGACLLFALKALMEREAQFSAAYLAFLRGMTEGLPPDELADLKKEAGNILLAQITQLTTYVSSADNLIWFYDLHLQDVNVLDEISDPSLKTINLAFLSNLTEFENYLRPGN
jgi:hypothetical protein